MLLHHQSPQSIYALLFCVWTDACPSWLQDSRPASTDSVQFRRLQVLNMWKENQQLEEEIREKLVSTVSTTATEGCIKVLKVLREKPSVQSHYFLLVYPT